jgi:hypothetical protein
VKRVIPEAQLLRDFNNDAPAIFGAILAALGVCVTTHEHVKLDPMPRMADFARWAHAGLGTLGFQSNDFLDAYQANQDAGLRLGLDSSPVGRALVTFMDGRPEWRGTASELLLALAGVDGVDTRSKQWPRTSRALSAALTRLGPALRSSGIGRESGHAGRERYVRLFQQS